MAHYKISTDMGMKIVKAKSLQQASAWARRQYGERLVQNVAPAEKKDIAWFRAMGGGEPEEVTPGGKKEAR